jgi:DNA-binding PadR family transcriptional regulator
MSDIGRITPATLDVLNVLVWSSDELHGFALAKQAGRPTGSVYVILSRLEAAGWVESRWETENVDNEGRPRRRFYRLSADGLASARQVLAERRGQAEVKARARGVMPKLGEILRGER